MRWYYQEDVIVLQPEITFVDRGNIRDRQRDTQENDFKWYLKGTFEGQQFKFNEHYGSGMGLHTDNFPVQTPPLVLQLKSQVESRHAT